MPATSPAVESLLRAVRYGYRLPFLVWHLFVLAGSAWGLFGALSRRWQVDALRVTGVAVVLSFAAMGAYELGRRSGLVGGGLFGLAACSRLPRVPVIIDSVTATDEAPEGADGAPAVPVTFAPLVLPPSP